MEIKLVLNHKQLDALSTKLESRQHNTYLGIDGKAVYYVQVIAAGTEEAEPNNKECVPMYHVTIRVAESYCVIRDGGSVTFKTPLVKLAQLFTAIGLFPKKDDVLVKSE